MKTIECKPEELFISLLDEFGEGLYVQRLWYTLPFENHKDRKKLSYVRDDDFRTMCKAYDLCILSFVEVHASF